MKKSKKISIYILLIISIFIFNGQHVYAAEQCGYRYFDDYQGYTMYYNHDGYCTPGGNIIAQLRGLKSEKGWNTKKAVKVNCEADYCLYYFDNNKLPTKCETSHKVTYGGYDSRFEDVKYRAGVLECVGIYTNTQSKYLFEKYQTVPSIYGASCLKEKKGDGEYVLIESGTRYAIDDYGYENTNYNNCINSKPENTGDPDNSGNTGNTGSPSCSSNILYSGCTGSSVQNLQTKLKAVQGCDIEIDGKYGPKTKDCVKEFQKSNNLYVDGVADSKTISALDEAYTKLQQGSSNTNELYYYITFDTNGGAFANGETKRNVYYNESELTMKPATIPGKSGYKFLGWYNGNILYTFGGKLTSNITLTAKYEKSTTTKYCLDGDVLDIDNNQCITVQEFDNQDKNKFYIINNKLLTIQTKFIYTRSCSSDGKYTVTYEKAEGSNNTVSCDSEDGYVRDTWRAEDTCQSDKTCPIKDGENSCQRIYRGTCYKSYDPGDTALGTEPDNTYNKDIKNNATESPQTGGGIIALIIVTLSIIGLSIFCYKVYNNKKEEV